MAHHQQEPRRARRASSWRSLSRLAAAVALLLQLGAVQAQRIGAPPVQVAPGVTYRHNSALGPAVVALGPVNITTTATPVQAPVHIIRER